MSTTATVDRLGVDFFNELERGGVPAMQTPLPVPYPVDAPAAGADGVTMQFGDIVSPDPERVPYLLVRETKREMARAF
ncbi:hypothetical protein [Dermatobacter hominis]|uniref:hypothetical protein n=1 Tax=Dermatobacter hominis TaxID=2884263 RepID=UPI001D1197CD|nr:hypothetical protein [Dermatobacter hominis]UDY35522.1 hypothetical protein LH044_19600 [Dermatobacter hominis]